MKPMSDICNNSSRAADKVPTLSASLVMVVRASAFLVNCCFTAGYPDDEAACSPKTLVPIYQTIWHYIPKDVICGAQLGFLYFRNKFFSDNFVFYEDYNFILNMKKSYVKEPYLQFSACSLRL
jgi:hypothetical protein